MLTFDRYSWFILDELPFIPRIGECIEIPFLREKVGCSIYYIESIDHELTDSKQSVNIHLNPSSPNLYFRLRKDEAYLKGEISSDVYYSKKDWEIKEKLKLRKF